MHGFHGFRTHLGRVFIMSPFHQHHRTTALTTGDNGGTSTLVRSDFVLQSRSDCTRPFSAACNAAALDSSDDGAIHTIEESFPPWFLVGGRSLGGSVARAVHFIHRPAVDNAIRLLLSCICFMKIKSMASKRHCFRLCILWGLSPLMPL